MTRQLKLTGITLFLLWGFSLAAPLIQPAPAAAFDIKKGIVGNLSEVCKNNGDCTLCDFVDLFVVLQKVILYLFAGLALVLMIWGGQGMIMAAGNQEKFTAGRKLITSTLLGVLIILAGYFLTSVLYSIIVTPVGQKPKTVLTQDWWKDTLGCAVKVDTCAQKLPGATCKNIDTCGTYITGTTIDEKRQACSGNSTSCQLGLCSGGNEMVCCK